MITFDIDNLRYPIGKFTPPRDYTATMMAEWIQTIEQLPGKLRMQVHAYDDGKLNTPYREEGWTVRQVVHHLADSHMNAYIRMKLSITEDLPTIKPYLESRWAELEDGKHSPVEISLQLLEGLHQRWVIFMKSFKPDDWKRKFFHPQSNREFELQTILALYAWHCNHHMAHIVSLANRNGW